MERDPLALPGDPGYESEPDNDIEVLGDDNRELKIELVPADINYVNKLTGVSRRGRKKKEDSKVIDTGLSQLKVQLIGENEIDAEEDEFRTEPRGRGRPRIKPGRPKKLKKHEDLEMYFKPNFLSTHFSRSSRYEQLQEKKDEFLQQENARKAAFREKQQKYMERAKQKYLERKAQTVGGPIEPKSSSKFPYLPKKMSRRINMLAMKVHHIDNSKSKEELIDEMSTEWKSNRQQFWENYKKRWKQVAFRRVKPMTAERLEFLQQRKQQIDQMKQELTQNRVSTRGSTKDISPEDSQTGDEEPNVINYAELDHEESFNEAFDDDEAYEMLKYGENDDEDNAQTELETENLETEVTLEQFSNGDNGFS